MRATLTAVALLAAGLAVPVANQVKTGAPGGEAKPFVYVPDTVSAEFRDLLKKLPDPALRPRFPAPDDLEGWKRFHEAREKDTEPRVQRALKEYQPTLAERSLGGVPVLDIKPKGWSESRKVLVYLHGGAYTMGSARSSLIKSVPAADATGYRVIAVD